MSRAGLSKSRLTAFRQCPKRLWLEVNKPQERVYGPDSQHFFDVGHQVGEIARREYLEGILIQSDDNLDQAIVDTQNALPLARPIFEATFRFEDVLVRADLLLPVANGWHMAEVKSTTGVKDYHLDDVAAQVWVIRGCGLSVVRASVRHIDNRFVLTAPNDYKGLLADADVLPEAETIAVRMPDTIAEAKAVLVSTEPAITTGDHCETPFSCPFRDYCTRSEPDGPTYPVTLMPGSSGKKLALKLMSDGYNDLALVPADRIDNVNQKLIHAATVSGIPYWDSAGAQQVLAGWGWPRHYLDFETISTAVPMWIGSRPYVQAPFQFSCHSVDAEGSVTHRTFLDLTGDDPSRACAAALIEYLGTEGAIVSYSAFERTTIRALALRFPDMEPQLSGLAARVVDLLPVVKSHFYHRDMKGSYSIKAVLPTIAPQLDYSQLGSVKDGLAAQMAYLEAISPTCTDERRRELGTDLERYCTLDSLAMIELAKSLISRVGSCA